MLRVLALGLRQVGAVQQALVHADGAPFDLVYLRDKTLLFDKERTGFVMYAVERSTWVALGDPVCSEDRIPDLLRLFLDRCDDFDATPVFHEVRPAPLHHYVDLGLHFLKLGEEAKVNLQAFSLEAPQAARLKDSIRRVENEGARFRVFAPEETLRRMDELKAVSDDWLKGNATGERGFSTGFFDPRYLSLFPVAVIECDRQILAFANLLAGSQKQELAADLMRYEAARAYLLKAASTYRAGSDPAYRARVLRTKTFVTQEATRVCADLFALGGGRHYVRGGRLSGAMADVFAGTALRPPLALALDLLVETFMLE